MGTTVIKAFAKINLAIDVLGRREDGYHDIDTITIPLKLHDSIEITPLPDTYDTTLGCDDPTLVCDESNLAYKALSTIRERYPLKGEYRMYIYKKIPVEAGLGGGSADAAAIMRALTQYLPESELEREKFYQTALQVGSDVPVCLYNKPARVKGIGEDITPIHVAYPYLVLIVKPKRGLSTAEVYKDFDEYAHKLTRPDIDRLVRALETGDEAEMKESIINVLTEPAISAVPEIGDVLERMANLGLELRGMSGSGSACFALSKDKKLLKRASRVFEEELGYETYLTEFNI